MWGVGKMMKLRYIGVCIENFKSRSVCSVGTLVKLRNIWVCRGGCRGYIIEFRNSLWGRV